MIDVFFGWFVLYNEKEPNKDEIDEKILMQISKNFNFNLVSDRRPVEIINLQRKWKNDEMKNINLL